MRKVREIDLLREARIGTAKIIAEVLHMSVSEVQKSDPSTYVSLLDQATRLMSDAKKQEARRLNEAPQNFWLGKYNDVQYGAE